MTINLSSLKIKKQLASFSLSAVLLFTAGTANAVLADVVAFAPTALAQISGYLGSTLITPLSASLVAAINNSTMAIMGSPALGSPPASLGDILLFLKVADNASKKLSTEAQDQQLKQLQANNVAATIGQQDQAGAFQGTAATCAQRAAADASVTSDYSRAYSASGYKKAAEVKVAKAPSPQEQLSGGVKNHRVRYCNKETDPKACSGAIESTFEKVEMTSGAPGKLADADVRSKSLFEGSGNGDDGANAPIINLTYTRSQLNAANAFIDNVVSVGDTPRGLSPAEFDTEDGKSYQGLKLAYTARMDLSRSILIGIAADRAPIAGSEKTIAAMMDGTTDEMGLKDYIKERVNQIKKFKEFSGTPQLSSAELMDIQVKARSDNAGWHKFINTASTEQIRREQVTIAALSLRLQLDQYRQSEKLAALQAIAAGEQTKANMLPRLQQSLVSLSRHQ